MILEIADFRILPGQQAEFEAALQQGVQQIISQADGYLRHQLSHCIESPERYVLLINWQTLEHHTIGFRSSPAFQKWRALVGPFFAAPPMVEHFELLD